MFFGKGGSRPEEVAPGDLIQFLDSLFEVKLGSFPGKAKSISEGLKRARNAYGNAYRNFEALAADPEIEYYWRDNSSVLRSQKGFYTTALLRIFESWDPEPHEAPNSYYKYNDLLERTESFISETLKANSTFKKVMFAYGKHFNDFKTSFSYIEKQRDLMKEAINRVGDEFSEYASVKEDIARLMLLKEELSANRDRIIPLDGMEPVGINGKDIIDAIGAMQAELNHLTSDISSLKGRIASLALPLERVSKKFDYMSAKKTRLSDILVDVPSRVQDENGYEEFRGLLAELRSSVDSGAIKLKNSGQISESIGELMRFDMNAAILSLRAMETKKLEIEGKINSSKTVLEREREKESAMEKIISDAEYAKGRKEEVISALNKTKTSIEQAIRRDYGRLVVVVG